jgi:hypothetical protein
MNTQTKLAIFIALGAVMVVGLIYIHTPAEAKISPKHCTNGGGNDPPGQQPDCKGGGLEQEPATNPAGNEPPGQNK